MDIDQFYRERILDDSVAREAGFNPYFPRIQSGLHDTILIEGRPFINLASNNYLGLADDPRLAEAAIAAIKKYGVSMCATPIASGYSDLFYECERELSLFTGLEAAIIFPSCYQANNGLFKMIAGPDDLIVFDRFVHSSLIEGIRGAVCENRPFRHNDLDHLEGIIKRSASVKQLFVVTESVFSTEGALSPFKEICNICAQYGAVPVVDDSHGIGVLGEHGKGILEYSGIKNYQGIYTASLGKAMAVNGGVIAGKRSLINFMRYFTSHLIYSTAIMPASLNALMQVIKVIDAEFKEMSGRLWSNTHRLAESLKDFGYELTSSQTPINSICPGNSVRTLKMAKLLYREGILSTPFIYPSVPENCGRIRLIAGANLKPGSIDAAIGVFERIFNEAHEMPPDT